MANRIEGQVVAVDGRGNLVTDITREMIADAPNDDSVVIHCDGHETYRIFADFADQPPMTLVAVIGTNNQLELAIVDDSAKIMLGVDVGETVEVRW